MIVKPKWFGKMAVSKVCSRERVYGAFLLTLIFLVPGEKWILQGGDARGWIQVKW